MRGLRAMVAAGLLLVAGLGAVLLWPGTAAGQDRPRENCPPGFWWDRMSGTGCVQEDVPANGRIGYDGHTICNDGFVGLYERRGTTDGKQAPGTPYTSFAYLLRCVTPDEYARLQQKVEGGGGTMPSAGTVGRVGAAAGATMLALGGGALLVTRRSAAEQHRDRVQLRRAELSERLADRRRRLQELEDLQRRIHEFAGRHLDLADLNEFASLVTGVIGAVLPPARLPGVAAGLASGTTTWLGAEYSASSPAELKDRTLRLLESTARVHGLLDAEIKTIEYDLEALDRRTSPPERVAAESFSDVDVMQHHIDRTREEMSGLLGQRNDWEVRQHELRQTLRDLDEQAAALRELITDERPGVVSDAVGLLAPPLAFATGLLALGPVGAAMAAKLGIASAAASGASVANLLRGLHSDQQREVLRLALRGLEQRRGETMYYLEDAGRREADAAARLDESEQYHARLRQHQADLIVQQNRGVLWPRR